MHDSNDSYSLLKLRPGTWCHIFTAFFGGTQSADSFNKGGVIKGAQEIE